MGKWLRRIRGAVGMGLTWAVAWGLGGALITLGFVLITGERPDAPFPLLTAFFGFFAGVIFSAVLSLLGGSRRFAEMSIRRFAAWGAGAGLLLSSAFVTLISLNGDPAFMWNLILVGPLFATATAGCAAGSLALARRGRDRELDVVDQPEALPKTRS